MNAFDYFFEHTWQLEKKFLVGKEEIRYNELYQRSFELAHMIKEQVGENSNILLLSPNSAYFMIVYLAVIKSGNVIIPLDPMIEEEGFKYIQRVTEPSMIFLNSAVKSRLSLDDEQCFLPERVEELLNENSRTNANDPLSSDNNTKLLYKEFDRERIAEIIFTSGSTGEPKGVMLSHKNLVANTSSIVEYLKLGEGDRMLVVLPFYYCYGLSLLHTHLRVGGSIVFNNAFIFIGTVINDLKNYDCTGFAGVPSHFQILLRKSDTFKTTEFPHLKYVTQAGGKLATVFIDEFRDAHPEIDFIVMYGQTEATARLSYLPVHLYEERKGSIGKGIPGVKLRVVNEAGEDVEPGETGEVIARGDNVMTGYYKDEDGTAAAIRNSWLYTGDLGTVDDDGYIYLSARSKEIIKVGGKRISPKEIEAIILAIPEVVDCTVDGVEDEVLGEAIKATVVCNWDKGKGIDAVSIKEHCAQHLALHKVPQIVEIKDQINMSATGKKIKGSIK
jgi:acyl-CoA synthetase (AMP-forming)/AMP-acid ligase II